MSNFENIDLNHIRILFTLLETQSVTRTARQLGISQPGVSRALAALRQSFNDPLLVKTNHGMTLTQRATQLQAPLNEWMAATLTILRSQAHGSETPIAGHVRVASTDYGVLSVLEPAMPILLSQAPGLFVDVVDLSPENLKQLSDGVIDVVISGWDPEPGRVHEKYLFQETCRCIFRRGHPLEQPGTEAQLGMDELLDWPHVVLSVHGADMDPLAPSLRHFSRPRKVAARLPYLVSALTLLQRTDAVFIGPTRAVQRLSAELGLASRPIPPQLGQFGYWLYWHERSRRDPVVMWLVDVLGRASMQAPTASAG
ncbi:LysR family transcriptional regulator [Pseudomonas sp. S 311-6]|nr:LysR family transcriptional regulator [Pseudomonas sp. S 311-6]